MARRQIGYLFAIAALLVLIASRKASAVRPLTPDVEVKFLLNPLKVLDAGNRPVQAVRKAFALARKPVLIRMLFLDDSKRQFDRAGWFIRLRKFQGQSPIEITFKRRYPVNGGLDAAVDEAAREGFDAAQTGYAAEVDWTYRQRTLSFADEEFAGPEAQQTLALPSVEQARKLVAELMPPGLRHFKQDGWAQRILSEARVYGPMQGLRWYGSRPGIGGPITLEVWTLPPACRDARPMVEISFKLKRSGGEAAAERERLLTLLKDKGWLLESGGLKTQRLLDCAQAPG